MIPEVLSKPKECLDGAHDLVGIRALRDLLTTDAILLVSERKSSGRDGGFVHVIQRRVGGIADDVSHGEDDILESEGLGTASTGTRGVLGGPQEPVEGNN